MLVNDRVKVDEEAFNKDIEFIRAMIRYDIDLALFGVEEARRRLIADDPQAAGRACRSSRKRRGCRRTRAASRAQASREGR